ncbi:DJ-1/PfpI family protein [Opitutaceae bacterium]|nr:DJ-1/PfpI family protein [Opitutaceae bacterium]
MATILTILPEGFEEIEAITPIDLWRRAEFDVTVASLGAKTKVTGRSGITLHAETSLSAIAPTQTFDLLFLPGGPGVSHLRESPEVRDLLGRQVLADKWIAAICAAPLVLHDAGLLAGRKFTAHPTTSGELTLSDSSPNVLIDGKIITSKGAGTALPFALEVISALKGKERAEEISLSICA